MKKQFKKRIKIFLLKTFMQLHNYSYKNISKWAKKIEGVHPKTRITKYHDFFIKNVELSDNVLDIGHGNGSLAENVAEKAKKVVGIDINHRKDKKAKKENVEFIRGDATKYNFNDKFDKIILSNVLEHIEDREEFLTKLHNISDTILLRVPMIDRDWTVLFKKEMGVEYRLDKTHFIEYTLETLNQELETSDWKLISYQRNWSELWGVLKEKINVV